MSKTENVSPLVFEYKNWQGIVGIRHIIPQKIYWGKTEWHPKEQWLLEAMDIDKNEVRTFAVNDIIRFISQEAE